MIQSALHLPTLLLLLPLMADTPAPGKPPAEIVETLLSGKVRALSELADLVGPIPRDPTDWNQALGPITRSRPSPSVAEIKVSFDIDIFHQDPEKVADPALAGYEIELLWPRAACRKLLESRLGEPRMLQREGKRVLQLAKLYFLEDSGADDRCRLAWYSDPPEGRPRGFCASIAVGNGAIRLGGHRQRVGGEAKRVGNEAVRGRGHADHRRCPVAGAGGDRGQERGQRGTEGISTRLLPELSRLVAASRVQLDDLVAPFSLPSLQILTDGLDVVVETLRVSLAHRPDLGDDFVLPLFHA